MQIKILPEFFSVFWERDMRGPVTNAAPAASAAPDNTTTDGERRPLESHCALPGKFAGVSRMAKAQQMRWSRRGADLLLQVRCALYNGTLGTGFGQKFLPTNDPHPPMAVAA